MLNRIEQLRDRLSPAEARVADWLLSHADSLGDLRLATLARDAGVSEPTVVRFCRSIGTAGFSDLRLRLARYLATRGELLHAEVAADDPPQTVAEKVFGASIRELRRVQQAVDGACLDRAARAESAAIVDAVAAARAAGAATIALTSPASRLAAAAETTLFIDVDEDTAMYTPMSSRLAQLAMLDTLQICTAIRAGDAALVNLDASKAALARG